MISNANLDALADASPFIFVGYIRAGATSTAVVVTVEDVLRTPSGFGSLKGREVTVRLLQPLPAGRYVFFADPAAVGDTILVHEKGHLEASAQSVVQQVAAAQTRASSSRIERRSQAAALVAVGSVGQVRALGTGGGQLSSEVPWATAPFAIERVLKGPRNLHSVVLVGPRFATSRLPRVPALRPALHAILFLQPPPKEALDALPASEHGEAFFIADSSDIQTPDRLSEIEAIAERSERR